MRFRLCPSEKETVISQMARTVFDGQGLFYLLAIAGTTFILILAANTSFAGFPRLSAKLASDGFMPRQLNYRGSRLVYSYGIIALGLASSVLIILFQASVTRLNSVVCDWRVLVLHTCPNRHGAPVEAIGQLKNESHSLRSLDSR